MALLTLKFVTNVRDLDYAAVEFHGELDQSTLNNTEKEIAEFFEAFKRKFLVFDLANLGFINSEGIGFLVSTHMKLLKRGQQLILCGLKRNVEDVIQLIGLPKLIPVFPTMSAAIDHMKK